MLQVFGYSLTLGEFIAALTFFGGLVVGYINLHNKVSGIVDRNDHADKVMKEFKDSLVAEMSGRHNTLESRIFVAEQQAQRQEVFMTRVDERLVAVQATLEEIRRHWKT